MNIDCSKFKGRDFDLCTGEGHDGRPAPGLALSLQFRVKHFGNTTAFCPVNGPRIRVSRRDPEPNRAAPAMKTGPGTELMSLLKSLGITPKPGCSCNAIKNEMNRVSANGCREKREALIGKIRKNATNFGLADFAKAASAALLSGLAFKLNPIDPIPGLFDEAIRLSEEKERAVP